MTSVSLAPTVSGPARNALLLPLAARTTAWPEPAQELSALWILEVSGGLDSWELENSRFDVASDADSVEHVAGMAGWLTERGSPVASVAAAAGLALIAVSPPAARMAAARSPAGCTTARRAIAWNLITVRFLPVSSLLGRCTGRKQGVNELLRRRKSG